MASLVTSDGGFFSSRRASARFALTKSSVQRINRELAQFTERLRSGYADAKIRIFRRRVWNEFHAEFDTGGTRYPDDRYFNPELSADEFLFFRLYITNYKVPLPNGMRPPASSVCDVLTTTCLWSHFYGEYTDALLAGERACETDLSYRESLE